VNVLGALPAACYLKRGEVFIMGRMELLHYHTLRRGVQTNASPGSDRDLAPVRAALQQELRDSGLFEDVEVDATRDPNQLVIGLCHYRDGVTEQDVARYLERVWNDRLRYPLWEAHTVLVDTDHVEFEAATRKSTTGHYVTVHLVAQKARIPAQRVPLD
jgi:hypothetical protein